MRSEEAEAVVWSAIMIFLSWLWDEPDFYKDHVRVE
jgi:hypothetical protein